MGDNANFQVKADCVIVKIKPKIYPLDVVFSSAYIFTTDNYVLIDGDPEKEVLVEIRPKKKNNLKQLAREFNNELINYASYAIQSMRNQPLRQTIMNRVMLTNSDEPCEPSMQESELTEEPTPPWKDDEPWFDDPEGIAVPWEEKYGKGEDTKK